MNTTEVVALAADLLTRAYPSAGYHVVDLHVSDEFWDDETGDAAASVWQQYEADCSQLVDALSVGWGAPEQVTLNDRRHRATELGAYLADFIPRVQLWRRAGRTVCVGVGQYDKELPVQLVLAVGSLATDR